MTDNELKPCAHCGGKAQIVTNLFGAMWDKKDRILYVFIPMFCIEIPLRVRNE